MQGKIQKLYNKNSYNVKKDVNENKWEQHTREWLLQKWNETKNETKMQSKRIRNI